MGLIINACFDQIVPSEDSFDEAMLARVIYFKERGIEMLPPAVRLNSSRKYTHLDGRHRLIASYLYGIMAPELYLVMSQEDLFGGVIGHKEEVNLTNSIIFSRWECADYSSKGISVSNYHEHMKRLRNTHPFLESLEECKKKFRNSSLLISLDWSLNAVPIKELFSS